MTLTPREVELVLAEREACAKVAETKRSEHQQLVGQSTEAWSRGYYRATTDCAYYIRSRPQPSAPTGQAEPVAWLHQITEPENETMTMYSGSPQNPWSHWLSKHLDTCVYRCTPLYLHPTPPYGYRVPDGWKLVPVEPTEEMLMAGYDWDDVITGTETHPRNRGIYRAMLAASPTREGT